MVEPDCSNDIFEQCISNRTAERPTGKKIMRKRYKIGSAENKGSAQIQVERKEGI
jgi:hypothetical protein